MTVYLKCYDDQWDEVYQCAVDDQTAERARACGSVEISEVPFEGIPIKSRLRSERNAERTKDQMNG